IRRNIGWPKTRMGGGMNDGQGAQYRVGTILAAIILGITVTVSPVLAQTSGALGSIHGTIADESGGKLPGVTATLTSPAIQVKQMVAVADGDGNYNFGELPVGTYR